MDAPIYGLVAYLHVTDIERSIAFYRLLGLELVGSWEDGGRRVWANLRHGEAWLMLAAGTPFDAGEQAALLCAFHDDVEALRARCAASDLPTHVGPVTRPDYLPHGELRLHDPDGYVVLVGQRHAAPPPHREALTAARERADRYLEGLRDRPVAPVVAEEAIAAAFAGPLPERGRPAAEVVHALADAAEPGLVASAGGRYFGFVTGGALPAAVAADWLTATWDQNAALHVMSPAAAACEDAVARWALDLLGLPADAGVGLVTGAQMANVACLAAARHALLARRGWDVEADGLAGAPALRVLVGGSVHATVLNALRLLGLGAGAAVRVEADGEGRMRPDALARAVDAAGDAPLLVAAQAGDVGSGAFDPLDAIADVLAGRDAWLHVDGAFGLWAAAAPGRRHLLAGHDRADSWATDAHKWPNTPYDCGIAIVRERAALVGALGIAAPYLVAAAPGTRNGADTAPEASRRARAFAVWAGLASLGREGLADLVERTCALATRAADALRDDPAFEIANEVVLNQVLVRVRGRDDADGDRRTAAALAAVQRSGEAWLGGTSWHGRPAMRISVSAWWTGAEDVDRLVAALRSAAAEA